MKGLSTDIAGILTGQEHVRSSHLARLTGAIHGHVFTQVLDHFLQGQGQQQSLAPQLGMATTQDSRGFVLHQFAE